ncbi:MAG: Unknown protein [uncultured Sulfurovum sp.]|uniref:SWIM-type domain-containing protein n=1 Tax=uncultured Sulfurovum sp. TaxID=269237 RepID=A0A6S6UC22_9BACT|nr:MAG: Unknown protein [uncultured Sulfurovum sp.]
MFLKTLNRHSEFKDDLLKLTQANIKSMADSAIFSRGKRYYREHNVFDVKLDSTTMLTARVKGSYANSYKVKLYKEGADLRARCDCPYDDVCKHIVATLISINQERELTESIVLSQESRVLSYFETLSKAELIELLMEFSPENFKKEIILKDAPVEALNIRINEIASSIKYDIDDEELLYNPEQFQEKISEYMENLKIFVNQNPDEVFEIVFELVVEIEEKQEEGYLWIDYYDHRGEEYFDFDVFSDEIMALINKIQDRKSQLRLFMAFGALANSSGYLPFSYERLEIEDKRDLLQFFDKESSLSFYDFVEELLSFEEKESFLLTHDLKNVYEILITIYLENGKKELAIKIVEKLLKEKFELEYVQQLLALTEVSAERFRGFVSQVIEESSYRGFDFIVDGLKKVENPEGLEALWRDKNVSEYYKYLEQEKRIEEMFELLNKLPHNKEKFFKNHKQAYQKEAIAFFNAQIEEHLKTTGDNHYRAIADALVQLKALLDKDAFILKVQSLKNTYKRRRNFMAILEQRFGWL